MAMSFNSFDFYPFFDPETKKMRFDGFEFPDGKQPPAEPTPQMEPEDNLVIGDDFETEETYEGPNIIW